MPRNRQAMRMYSMAPVACKNWHPDTMSGTYLPPNTREASYTIFPIGVALSRRPNPGFLVERARVNKGSLVNVGFWFLHINSVETPMP